MPWDNSMDPTMMGLLGQFQPTDADRTEANNQALLAFGLSLLGTRKGQQMARLGYAGMNALNARNGSLAGASQAKRQSLQDASNALQLQTQMQANRDDQATREVMRSIYGERQPTNIDMAGGGPPSPMPAASAAPPSVSAGATLPGGNPLGKYSQYMRVAEQLYAKGAIKSAQEMEKKAKDFLPKLKEQKTLTQNGKRVTVNIYDDGTYQVLPDVSPDQEKLHFSDNGQFAGIGQDPFTGQVMGGGIPKQMTPGEVASNAVAQGNLAVNQGQLSLARQREAREASKVNDPALTVDAERGLLINTRTGETKPITANGQPVGAKGETKQAEASRRALQIIDQAEKILPNATSSFVGTGIDKVLSAGGMSTASGDAAAQLKALEGALMLNQPRMEGPQSDKDTMLYRQMAAQIGDSTVPVSQRKAALQVVKQLHQKYMVGGSGAATAGAPKTVKWSDLP